VLDNDLDRWPKGKRGGCVVSRRIAVLGRWLPALLVVLTPFTPCPARARELVYVANSGSDTVSVIDTEKQAVVQTISVGNGLRPAAVAISPDGKAGYVSSYSGTVAVIDTATNLVRASIPVGAPGQLLPSPDGSLLYVANGNSEGVAASVAVIDLRRQLFTNTIPVIGADTLALSPEGRTLYALARYAPPGGTLSIVDTASAAVAGYVQLGAPVQDGAFAAGLALSPDGTQALVRHQLPLLACARNDLYVTSRHYRHGRGQSHRDGGPRRGPKQPVSRRHRVFPHRRGCLCRRRIL
jgi:YVTN family beta-propeller protein